MFLETSCGIIPLQRKNNSWEVLLIQHRSGSHWGFPKGHVEHGENLKETAVRELQEETGLIVERFLYDDPIKDRYIFSSSKGEIDKTVNYFLAVVTGTVSLQVEEVLAAKWVPLSEASELISYPSAKTLCKRIAVQLTG